MCIIVTGPFGHLGGEFTCKTRFVLHTGRASGGMLNPVQQFPVSVALDVLKSKCNS